MKKLEIIANRSIEEDLFEKFRKENLTPHYTKIPVVHGTGNTNPKMGDSIWPEENFLLIIYCEEEIAQQIIAVIKDLKIDFPDEGIKLFEISVDASI